MFERRGCLCENPLLPVNMPLCHVCADLDFATISRRDLGLSSFGLEFLPAYRDLFFYQAPDDWIRRNPGPDAGSPASLGLTPYHKSLSSLEASASASSCEVCRLVQHMADEHERSAESALGLDYMQRELDGCELWLAAIGDNVLGFVVVAYFETGGGFTHGPSLHLVGGVSFCVDDGE